MYLKRSLSLLLTACLLVGLLPVVSLAADTSVLHNCNVPEGYHLFTELPTAEDPVTTETLYWGNAFNGVFYGMNSTFTASGGNSSATTTTDVAKMNTVTIHYGGNDATYGDYYYFVFTLASGTSYAVAYSSGYYSQNAIQSNGLPSGGWAHKHKLFYNAEEHIFFHRPSNSLTTMKAPQISATSQKIFTNYYVSDVLGDGKYPVRLYESCTSDGVAGENETHQWSGVCTCGYKFDYQEIAQKNYVVETRGPQTDTAYFWGVTQEDKDGDPTYFFDGVKNTSNFNTQSDIRKGKSVYVDTVEGGYHLYFLDESSEKQYICLGKNAADSYKTYIDVVSDAANATVFTWNAEYNTLVTNVVKDANGGTVDMVLGAYTSGSTAYTKISALTLGHLAQAHYFPSQLYVEHEAHTYSQQWSSDSQNHWKACFCGSRSEVTQHSITAWTMDMDGSGVIYSDCVCGHSQSVTSAQIPAFLGVSISLHKNFALNFYVKPDAFETGDYTDAYILFEMNGKEIVLDEYTLQNDSYVFTFDDLAPDMMNETVRATLCATAKDGSRFALTSQYSVAQYCYSALAMEATGDELRTLLVDILNYGAAAQLYRDGTVAADQLVNASLTQEQKAWGTTGDLRDLASVREVASQVDAPEATWYAVTLVMGDSIKIRVYFTADDITGLSVVATGISGQQWTIANEAIQSENGLYYVDFDRLTPTQMDQKISFCVQKGAEIVSDTLHYSIESYADVMLKDSGKSQELKNLVDAMIRYGDAAKAYDSRVYDLQQDVRYLGRTYESDGTQWFNWSASGFSVRFQGSGLKATIASNAPDAKNYAYLKVYVDGVEQNDILLDETQQTVVLAQDLDANEIHTVEVRKRNSPRSSTAGLLHMEVLNGKKLTPPAAKDKLIEFVGDSLTVGYSAADVNKEETAWSTKTEDGTKTYSKQVADAFDAEYMVTAISGRGVVMNNGGASGYLLPEIYSELDIYNTPGVQYDFALQPDVVVINLGTNDATNSGLDMDVFQAGVVSFIKTVRKNNPNAQIIWAYGLRTDTKTAEVAAAIEAAVAQLNAEGDSKVYYLPLDVASDMHLNHPTAAAYAPSGEKLIEKIAEITGW